jgi:hypothetical protein
VLVFTRTTAEPPDRHCGLLTRCQEEGSLSNDTALNVSLSALLQRREKIKIMSVVCM